MKKNFVSWNVNGLRAVIKKGFFEILENMNADLFMIQETKMQEADVTFLEDGKYNDYFVYMSSAIKKGYSGTLVFAKEKPISVSYGIDGKYSDEGRVLTLEYDKYFVVDLYSPNSQDELKRLDYRMGYEDDLREYLKELSNKKSVIVCGDLNVAHNEIDLKNPSINHFNPGFSDEERDKFTKLLESGLIDTFRYLYPDVIKYSWWSYRAFARVKNVGWRIDYFLVSKDLKDNIIDATIENDIYGSDHCPVTLKIDL
ncbi:MAG: exodeoxyribonuclease III [Bacilli bacterium]|nr:exodeoxyribonuclease III [Bacilli bacterium]